MKKEDIENVEFKVTRLKEGYDQDEVDNFLDQIIAYVTSLEDSLEGKQKQVVILQRELAEANRILAAYGEEPTRITPVAPVSSSAAKILEAAQKTADDVVESAHGEANKIKYDAQREAAKIVDEAGQDADARKNAAEAQAYHAEKKLKELRDKHEVLRAFLARHLEKGLEGLNTDPETPEGT